MTIVLAAELVVLAVGLGMVLRIGLTTPVRRELASAPWVRLAVGVGGVALAGVGIWAAIRWPELVHLLAIATAGLLAFAWWRARPGFGRRRGWPPGSLGIRASVDAVGDRNYYRDQARLHGPVFKMSQFGQPVVCMVGLAAGRELLHSQADALAGAPLPYNRFLPRGSLRYMTPEDHRREGAVFRAAFVGVGLAAAEATVRQRCRLILAELSARSRQSAEGIKLTEYWERWAAEALARFLFGIGPEDPRLGVLDQARLHLNLEQAGRRWVTRTEAIFQRAERLLTELEREAVAGSALGGLSAADPIAGDPTRLRNLFLIFRIGVGDLTSLLDWVVENLAGNPEWVTAVRGLPRTEGAPTGTQPSDLASRIVLETLRMEQSEYLYRRIVRPITVGGYSVPAGWLLRICVQESHRDPTVFPDPDRFNPDRFVGRVYGKHEYSPFGADTHGCLGVAMVLFLGRIFVEELSHGYDVRLVRPAPPERGSRHRHHWRPGASRQVVLTPLRPRETAP